MQNSKILRLPTLLFAVLLVACGGNAAAPASTSMPASTNSSVSANTPVAAVPSVTSAVATSVASANATAPVAPSSGPFAGIAQGTTPEGYHMLGNPSAPALLVMYSDFL